MPNEFENSELAEWITTTTNQIFSLENRLDKFSRRLDNTEKNVKDLNGIGKETGKKYLKLVDAKRFGGILKEEYEIIDKPTWAGGNPCIRTDGIDSNKIDFHELLVKYDFDNRLIEYGVVFLELNSNYWWLSVYSTLEKFELVYRMNSLDEIKTKLYFKSNEQIYNFINAFKE